MAQPSRATEYYREHRDDPMYRRRRRAYGRLYRETHPENPKAEILARGRQRGCALCGERASECLRLRRPGVDGKPLTVRCAAVKAMSLAELAQAVEEALCLCLNCEAKYEYGRVGLPWWVPEALRWR